MSMDSLIKAADAALAVHGLKVESVSIGLKCNAHYWSIVVRDGDDIAGALATLACLVAEREKAA